MNKNIVQISIEKFISGDRDKAIKQLEKYIKKNPSDHLAIYNLGYFYQQTKNTKEAIKNYLKVISINSDHWESKINLVIIYIETQDFELALKYVDEVFLSIDKDKTQCETLKYLKPNIFAKGGDRMISEIPESKICKKLGIQIIDGLGEKIRSSSDLTGIK